MRAKRNTLLELSHSRQQQLRLESKSRQVPRQALPPRTKCLVLLKNVQRRQAIMPCPAERCPPKSSTKSEAPSSEWLYEVKKQLTEWLDDESSTFEDESSEDETSSDEEEPEKKSSRPFGSLALRFKKWFTGHHHQEK
ncbi:hypothetical protein CEK25_009147 [Fusarium fujikuroi]|nr:hypothetical protein CEK25_009147 [Fusarium fujikuroi]